MAKIKSLVFIGSRANYGRLYMVLKEMQNNNDWLDFKIFLATSGTYLDLDSFSEHVDYKIDGVMYKDTGANVGFTTSNILEHASNYLASNHYDFCLIHGDRYENLSMALACFYNQIPIIHTEGGEVSGGMDNSIRDTISRLAKMHFTTTSKSYARLSYIYGAENIYNVGSPTIDYVFEVLERRSVNNGNPYAVVLYNPVWNEKHTELIEAILYLSKKIEIYWINPNVDPGFKDIIYDIKELKAIRFIKDVKPYELIRWLDTAHVLIGNTSAGIKEGAAIGIPYILVGDRQKEREVADNVIRVKMEHAEIVKKALSYTKFDQEKITYNGLFGNGDASKKIIKIIKEAYLK